MADGVLGIDLGTTSIKAGVFAEGACLGMVREPHPTRRDGNLAEQDPEGWLRRIDGAMAELGSLGVEIPRGALTSQVNTHVFVDRAGRPLMPAILWQDTRAAAEAAELDARVSVEEKIAWLGAPIPIDASHPLARMLWVSRHQPEVWEQTAHVLLPKDYALLHLTGELATDPLSNIGLVGLDGRYVAPILELVPGASERMAPIRGLTETMGTTRSGIAMATATMDGWVGLIGAGACQEGRFAYLSGTSEILGAASAQVTNTPGIIVFAEAEGLRLHAGPTQSGSASQDWFAAVTGVKVAEMAALIGAPRGRTPLFLPQLAGERAPLWDADLRGAFLGLEAGMGPADLARGVYEGVAFSARHVMEALEASADRAADRVMCGGGGFIPAPWGQIRADILGKRLERIRVNEPAVVGAAAIASAGTGLSLAEAHVSFAATDAVWEPNPAMRGFYDDLFGLYLEAIETNAALGRRISRLVPG